MRLPFTSQQFFDVFERYNLSVWPMQVILLCLAMVSVVCLFRSPQRMVFFILALLWLWMGIVYHMIFFSAINRAAWIFGIAFSVQGVLFGYFGIMKSRIQFQVSGSLSGVVGMIEILFALIGYPFLAYSFGHLFPRAPTFGVPCPSTIFTLGFLLFWSERPPWYMVVIPVLWSLVGLSAAVNMSIKEDYGLAVAGLVTVVVLLLDRHRRSSSASTTVV